jgi:hypothetical protein
LLADYAEACQIELLSPKASAALARRCLQGMIRNFWSVSKPRLVDEINTLQAMVDRQTWEAIDALRKIGNIAAHMEKDVNLIVDVDPDEARLLIELIETLFEEWYVARHDREQRMQKIKASADAKKAPAASAAKAPPVPPPAAAPTATLQVPPAVGATTATLQVKPDVGVTTVPLQLTPVAPKKT